MDRIKIVLFSAGAHEIQLYPYLAEEADMVAFPFEYDLKKKDIKKKKTVVILWYSLGDHNVFNKAKSLRQHFHHLPIILIGKNPAPQDLLKAIRLKVDNFLTLPLDKAELHVAVQQSVAPSAGKNLSDLFGLRQMGKALFQRLMDFRSARKKEASPSLGIIPSRYSSLLADPKPGKGKFYDLNVCFFDDLKITRGSKTLPAIKGKKNKSLLAYLLYHHHRPIHRDVLMDKFWGDVSPVSARNSLYVSICSIRKYFTPSFPKQEVILLENDCYAINSELEILTDFDQFNFFYEKGKSIETLQGLKHALGAYNKALALYQGDFLGRMRYEDWCESIRANLIETYLFLLNQVCAYFFERNEYDACINIGKKMLMKDNCLEEVHRKLIRSYHALGLNDLAIRQYLKCKETLEKELGIQPSDQTRELFRKIQTGRVNFKGI